ncbi:ABC transporter substrate-binding protein [Shimia biformata]|uniref:ABC transporter substrate-binding protein n=1 Tax=Shimia biformata TaxID=1294299 RepID=UPI00194F5A23|nr:ABC transporter substrate-binding protein [Shimia biformata]
MKRLVRNMTAAAAIGAASMASAETQGVSDTEVLIGAVSDLSGVFAAVGVPAVNGANLYFNKVNEAGGVHGRQIRYIVEDNGYQMPRAMQGYNKLLNRDKVFAMMQSLGTPMNLAGFKLMDPKGIPNVNPLTASSQMLMEPMDNKYTGFSDYVDQGRIGVEYVMGETGATNVCGMYLPNEFGIEVNDGAKHGTEAGGGTWVGETTHKPDESDFVGSLSKLSADGCQIAMLAVPVRQAITVVGTAKKMGLTDMKFIVSSAGFLDVVAAVPGGVTEGLYASAGWQSLAGRADEPAPAAFIEEYTAAYGEAPSMFAMLGYATAELLVKALDAAGPDLTHESFQKGMESLDFQDDLVGNHMTYGPGDHRGAEATYISQVVDGKWKTLAAK